MSKKILFVLLIVFIFNFLSISLAASKIYDVVGVTSYNRYFIIKSENGYGVASSNKLVIPPEYSNITVSKHREIVIVEKTDDNNLKTNALFYINGEQITPFINCEYISKVGNDVYYCKEGNFFLYNIKNKQTVSVSVVENIDKPQTNIVFKNNGKWGIIQLKKEKLKIILPFEYDDINSTPFFGICKIKQDNKYALFSLNKNEPNTQLSNKELIFYDDIKFSKRSFADGRQKIYIKENGKWKYLCDNNGYEKEGKFKEISRDIILSPISIPVWLAFGDWTFPDFIPKKIKIND